MPTTQINIACDEELKSAYEKAIRKMHYAGITEAIRDHMRKVVKEQESTKK